MARHALIESRQSDGVDCVNIIEVAVSAMAEAIRMTRIGGIGHVVLSVGCRGTSSSVLPTRFGAEEGTEEPRYGHLARLKHE